MFPIIPANTLAVSYATNSEGIFWGGYHSFNGAGYLDASNKVSNSGVVANDVSGVGTARGNMASTEYGGDKGIFAFGNYDVGGGEAYVSTRNLVSNSGVLASDAAGAGTARRQMSGCTYGDDKDTAIIAFGYTGSVYTAVSNLVSNSGVVASDTAGVDTIRAGVAACEFGGDKGIFAFGYTTSNVKLSMSSLVSNSGVIASDTAGVGTERRWLAACAYGGNNGIFAFGDTGIDPEPYVGMSNLVSSTGVVASDVAAVGTVRGYLGACEFGDGQGIFGYGATHGVGPDRSITNKVSDTGVIASDTAGVGSVRFYVSGCSFN